MVLKEPLTRRHLILSNVGKNEASVPEGTRTLIHTFNMFDCLEDSCLSIRLQEHITL